MAKKHVTRSRDGSKPVYSYQQRHAFARMFDVELLDWETQRKKLELLQSLRHRLSQAALSLGVRARAYALSHDPGGPKNWQSWTFESISKFYERIISPDAAAFSQIRRVVDNVQRDFEQYVAIRNQLIKAHIRTVAKFALVYAKYGISWGELISEGSIGLMRAIDSFDLQRGVQLNSYAMWWVRKSILHAIAYKADIIRKPLHLQRVLRQIRNAERQLQQNLLRAPDKDEVADMLNTTVSTIDCKKAIHTSTRPVSMSDRLYPDDDLSLENVLADTTIQSQEDVVVEISRSRFVLRLMAKLPTRYQTMIKHRYGIGTPALEYHEIGKLLNVSKQRIKQMHIAALRLLRKAVEEEEHEIRKLLAKAARKRSSTSHQQPSTLRFADAEQHVSSPSQQKNKTTAHDPTESERCAVFLKDLFI